MHVGVADERAECPQQRSAGNGIRLDVAIDGEAADQRGPGCRDIADELCIEGAQGEHAKAAERADAVEARHFQEALGAEVENLRGDAQHRQRQMLGEQEVAPSLADGVVIGGGELDEHMAALGVGAELGLLAPGRRAGKLPGAGCAGKGRVAGGAVDRHRGRHGDEAVAGAFADQQVADGVMPMGEQRPEDVGVAPMLGVGRQAEAGSMRRGIGAAEIALGPHVEQPPRQPVAVQGRAVGLHHDEAFRADRDERAEGLDLPFVADAEDWRQLEATRAVPQGVTNSRAGPDADDLVAHGRQRTRHGWLTKPCIFNDLPGKHGPFGEEQTDRVGMARHGDE